MEAVGCEHHGIEGKVLRVVALFCWLLLLLW